MPDTNALTQKLDEVIAMLETEHPNYQILPLVKEIKNALAPVSAPVSAPVADPVVVESTEEIVEEKPVAKKTRAVKPAE